jgi:hypothetical protein
MANSSPRQWLQGFSSSCEAVQLSASPDQLPGPTPALVATSSLPPGPPRALRALVNETVGLRSLDLALWPSWSRRRWVKPNAVLAGRATIVPFTAVMIGAEWTATDNTTTAVIWAGHRLRR